VNSSPLRIATAAFIAIVGVIAEIPGRKGLKVKSLLPRTRRTAFATVAAVAALGAATAFAAAPKPGFHYENADVHGTTVNVITMTVAEDATFTATGYDPKCTDADGNYKGFQLTKKPVDASNGKFKYEGKAINTSSEGPAKIKLDLKGKFTSSKHAKGSYTLEGCEGKVKFKTDWTLGG
jgi:hypothetical protein